VPASFVFADFVGNEATVADFKADFVTQLAAGLSIDAMRIKVSGITEGSIVVATEVATDSLSGSQ
jgi:hypothetical protein